MRYKHGYMCEACKKDLELQIYQGDKDQDQMIKFVDLNLNIKAIIRSSEGLWSEAKFDNDRIILCAACFRKMFAKILTEGAE